MENEKDPELNDAAHLSKLSRKPFLNAPDGYFESLPDQLHKKIAAANEHTSVLRFKPVAIGISFMIAAVITVALIFRTNEQIQPKTVLSYDDLVNSGYIYDYDESVLINEFTLVSTEPGEATETEEYLYNNTDESFLREAL